LFDYSFDNTYIITIDFNLFANYIFYFLLPEMVQITYLCFGANYKRSLKLLLQITHVVNT